MYQLHSHRIPLTHRITSISRPERVAAQPIQFSHPSIHPGQKTAVAIRIEPHGGRQRPTAEQPKGDWARAGRVASGSDRAGLLGRRTLRPVDADSAAA